MKNSYEDLLEGMKTPFVYIAFLVVCAARPSTDSTRDAPVQKQPLDSRSSATASSPAREHRRSDLGPGYEIRPARVLNG